MNRLSYSMPDIEIVELCVSQVIATSYQDGGPGLKWDYKWDDITFFEED